jgi:hypothetical protein
MKQQQLRMMMEDQERAISTELDRRKQMEIREEKMRTRICEQSEELRALELRLKACHTNKERSNQISLSKAIDERKKVKK